MLYDIGLYGGIVIAEKPKFKYDAAYISYVETGESAAVFITRDVVEAIDTKGKWVDVLSINGSKNEDGQWDISTFTVELYPRQKHPHYPEGTSEEDKKYVTWKNRS